MNFAKDIIETVRKLSALEARTSDVVHAVHRVEDKLDDLLERVARLEADQNNLKENLKNEVLIEIVKNFAGRVTSSQAEEAEVVEIKSPDKKD